MNKLINPSNNAVDYSLIKVLFTYVCVYIYIYIYIYSKLHKP